MKSIILTLLICDVGGAGTTQQAQPRVDTFLRHMEKAGGWKPNTFVGTYHTRGDACATYIDEHHPALVVADLSSFLARQRAWKLAPLAHMGGAEAKRYFLLVRQGSYQTLDELDDKTIMTTLSDERFVRQVVLGGKLGKRKLRLKTTRRPLKGLRAVARGKADATIVDEAAYGYLGELDLPAKLAVLHRSPPLPGLTLAMAGKRDRKLEARIKQALPKLCNDAGAELCKTLQIDAFVAASTGLYRRLQKTYR